MFKPLSQLSILNTVVATRSTLAFLDLARCDIRYEYIHLNDLLNKQRNILKRPTTSKHFVPATRLQSVG